MANKLNVKFENGKMNVKVDGDKIETIQAIVLKSTGTSITCDFTHNSFSGTVTSDEGEIEFDIPPELARALK